MHTGKRHQKGDVTKVPQISSSMERVSRDWWLWLPAQKGEAINRPPDCTEVILDANTVVEPSAI